MPLQAATVIATIENQSITDTDITARTKLMALQGDVSTDNRRKALQNIIDDAIKLKYASNFNAIPSDKEVNTAFTKMKLDGLTPSEQIMAKTSIRANIAWQSIVYRTIIPTISVSKQDIQDETLILAREKGLPIEMTIIRLIDIPYNIYKLLKQPNSCDEAMTMAVNLGGNPQKFTAIQYELSDDIRERIVGLKELTWSNWQNDAVLLVCKSEKTSEYRKLDSIIKQNVEYKKAMDIADRQLKQLRRKALIIINDTRYKL